MRVYKAMRSSGIPSKVIRHALTMGASSGYCSSYRMAQWCEDVSLQHFVHRPQDTRGLFHACLKRWTNSIDNFGLSPIIEQSDLLTWVQAGLTTEVMVAALPQARERDYDLAAYLVLMRRLNLMEYWAKVAGKDPTVYRRLLRLRSFWVNPETGYGPLSHDVYDHAVARYIDEDALYPLGLRTLDLISFQPIGMSIPIMVPVDAPVETVSNHVLVLVTDIEQFMPFIKSRWLDEYGA